MFGGGRPVYYDYMRATGSVQYMMARPGPSFAPSFAPQYARAPVPKIRKEFPETWIFVDKTM